MSNNVLHLCSDCTRKDLRLFSPLSAGQPRVNILARTPNDCVRPRLQCDLSSSLTVDSMGRKQHDWCMVSAAACCRSISKWHLHQSSASASCPPSKIRPSMATQAACLRLPDPPAVCCSRFRQRHQATISRQHLEGRRQLSCRSSSGASASRGSYAAGHG